MPISEKHCLQYRTSATSMATVLITLTLASTWLLQDSINEYIQQTYHRTSPLDALTALPGWSTGSLAWKTLNQGQQHVQQNIANGSGKITGAFNQRLVLTERYHQHQRELAAQAEALRQAKLQADALQQAQESKVRYLSLSMQDKVFLAGDSLMQGVAPHLQRQLATRHRISSTNLSKQSTGLSYPGFFDWPATIEQTIVDDPSIHLVVMLLGPNDPWDMPDPAHKGGPFLKFGSAAWEQVYRARVARIVSHNSSNGLSTLWVGAPGMRKQQLDTQMRWLMTVIQDEVERQGAVFIDSRHLLPGAGDPNGYQDSVDIDGKPVKMRSADGIHFSTAGQQRLAREILETLQLPN